jgi:hypothetical protein
MNKQEFIAALKDERQRLASQLGARAAGELERRPGPDEWSVKDALAHLTFWEQYAIGNVRRALAEGASPQWMDNAQETATNADILARNRERPVAELLAEMERSYIELVALVEGLSESDLTDPERFSWMRGKPLWSYLANEGYGEHYHEHLAHHFSW